MDTTQIIHDLVAAHRSADAYFAAAQAGNPADRQLAFARIIGRLQGTLVGAAIDLGFRGPIRAELPDQGSERRVA
jgi:hypothetical protein